MVSLTAIATQRYAVLGGDRSDRNLGPLVTCDTHEMVKSRRREACAAPIVHGRHAGLRQAMHLTGAAQRVDQSIRESIHAHTYADPAHRAQADLCRNGICQYGTDASKRLIMDLEEIKARMTSRGYQQADLANLLGIDPSAVSRRLTGKRPFKHSDMLKVEAWLSDVGSSDHGITGSAVRMVPIIGQVAAGNWREAIQHPTGLIPITAEGSKSSAFGLRVTGDSMDLEIADGGIVIIDPDDKALFPGRLFVVLNDEGEATFKQFESEPARLVPRSTNAEHKVIDLSEGAPFTIVGRVTALYRPR